MFLDELGGCPKAAHDDIVDAFVHGLSRCWQPELKLDDDTAKTESQSRPAFAGVRKREF